MNLQDNINYYKEVKRRMEIKVAYDNTFSEQEYLKVCGVIDGLRLAKQSSVRHKVCKVIRKTFSKFIV